MKKTVIMLALAIAVSTVSYAQKKFKFTKVTRDTKKEAKKYEKDGWQVEPGNTPIAQQLDGAFRKQAETDTDGFPKWVTANGSSVAQTQAAAEMQDRTDCGRFRAASSRQYRSSAGTSAQSSRQQGDWASAT